MSMSHETTPIEVRSNEVEQQSRRNVQLAIAGCALALAGGMIGAADRADAHYRNVTDADVEKFEPWFAAEHPLRVQPMPADVALVERTLRIGEAYWARRGIGQQADNTGYYCRTKNQDWQANDSIWFVSPKAPSLNGSGAIASSDFNAESGNHFCHMVFDVSDLRYIPGKSVNTKQEVPYVACKLMVHELGHQHGLHTNNEGSPDKAGQYRGHNPDVQNIMYYNVYQAPVPECADEFLPRTRSYATYAAAGRAALLDKAFTNVRCVAKNPQKDRTTYCLATHPSSKKTVGVDIKMKSKSITEQQSKYEQEQGRITAHDRRKQGKPVKRQANLRTYSVVDKMKVVPLYKHAGKYTPAAESHMQHMRDKKARKVVGKLATFTYKRSNR